MDVVEEIVINKQQTDGVLARIRDQAVTEVPVDLYIPPDAMQVFLEVFQGPFDLLLYLIKKHNIDILDIPVAKITNQYLEYVELMQIFQLELVADYLEMAAVLAEIKSRMLLPRTSQVEEEEEDPRAELVRRLQEYEKIKCVAEELEAAPRYGRDFYRAFASPPPLQLVKPQPIVLLDEILLAFKDVLKRVDLVTAHNIEREALSVREKMSIILQKLSDDRFVSFLKLFDVKEGRLGVVVTFLAILEMVKERVLELSQREEVPFSPIYVRRALC